MATAVAHIFRHFLNLFRDRVKLPQPRLGEAWAGVGRESRSELCGLSLECLGLSVELGGLGLKHWAVDEVPGGQRCEAAAPGRRIAAAWLRSPAFWSAFCCAALASASAFSWPPWPPRRPSPAPPCAAACSSACFCASTLACPSSFPGWRLAPAGPAPAGPRRLLNRGLAGNGDDARGRVVHHDRGGGGRRPRRRATGC